MATKSDLEVFTSRLKAYKKLIETDIAAYSQYIRESTLEQYGAGPRLTTDVFLDILGRKAKRIRGALVMVGYEMSGGTNKDAILQAARAIEMLHAYILIIDDIQDRSLTRRGGPTAHVVLETYHQEHKLPASKEHFGISMALNAAYAGAHAAQMIMANIDMSEQMRLNAISIINRTMVITAHGQTADIMLELLPKSSMDDVDKVMTWKTSQYSFLNPLHVGMVLAGAGCEATDAITDYAVHLGKAYQITDDALDVFGDSMDDIKEGKRTVISIYALENATKTDKKFLSQMLGNAKLTPAQLKRCQDILVRSGAQAYAQKLAKQYVDQAISSLQAGKGLWPPESIQFLRGLAEYITTRTA